MIKAVLFDVGGTLIAPHPSVGAIYAEVASQFGVLVNPVALNERFRVAWKSKKSQRGLIDKSWWRTVVQEVFQMPEVPFFEAIYKTFEDEKVWRIYPDVIPVLDQLRSRGIRLVVASNWDERLPALLKRLNLANYFEKIFYSHELQVAKPDVAFFRHALEHLALDPIEVLHVGDDPEEDIEGAQRAGIRAYLIDRLRKPKNSRTLSSFEEILLRI